jgi:hypothetical protein
VLQVLRIWAWENERKDRGQMPKMLSRKFLLLLSFSWMKICVLGFILLAVGIFLIDKDLSPIAAFVSQTGSINPEIAGRTRLLPFVFVLIGIEMASLGFAEHRIRRKRPPPFHENPTAKHPLQIVMAWLMSLYFLCGGLTLNFCALSVGMHLWHLQTITEKLPQDFGEASDLYQEIRHKTPENANIFIQTERPLKYLLNYHLFPRKFYIYPNRLLDPSMIPAEWMNTHHVGWILVISNEEPLRYVLRKRQDEE